MNHRKWTLLEQSVLLKMTGELLSRGYNLSDALESVGYHLPKPRTDVIDQILQHLKEGYPLYSILEQLKFDEYVTGYIFFAEQHGGLETAFMEGGNMLQKRSQDISKLVKIISYPLFLLMITLFLFSFVKNYLLPRFVNLYSTMDVEANFFSKVIYIVDVTTPILFFFLFLMLILFVIYYFLRYKSLSPVKQKMVLIKFPIAAKLLRLFYTHYFCFQFGHLLAGGLSINESLSMIEKNRNQPFYKQIACEMKAHLKKGDTLVEIFQNYSFFEKDIARIVKHGQENGKLPQELLFLSSQCLLLMEEAIEQLLKKVQPIIFLFIGFMIISMYLAVLLPMFQLLNGI